MENIQINYDALMDLLPACIDFYDKCKQGNDLDPHVIADEIAEKFGIEDIDAFAARKLEEKLGEGLGLAMDPDDAAELATLFASQGKVIAELMMAYLKDGKNATELARGLNQLNLNNSQNMQVILQHSLGLSDESIRFLGDKLGGYTIAVLCFTQAYKIYQRAANDARIAKKKRVEIETRCNEAIGVLKESRTEMENSVNAYLLARLPQFNEGMNALDKAILNGDDDGYIAANKELWEIFGRKSQYSNTQEFDELMLSDEMFKL